MNYPKYKVSECVHELSTLKAQAMLAKLWASRLCDNHAVLTDGLVDMGRLPESRAAAAALATVLLPIIRRGYAAEVVQQSAGLADPISSHQSANRKGFK